MNKGISHTHFKEDRTAVRPEKITGGNCPILTGNACAFMLGLVGKVRVTLW